MRPRVVVVVKRTAYRLFVEEEQDERIGRLLQKNDPSVRRMRRSHDEHEGTLEEVDRALDHLGARAVWIRRAHARFSADSAELVLTVGGDGTLLAASHRVGSTPILEGDNLLVLVGGQPDAAVVALDAVTGKTR